MFSQTKTLNNTRPLARGETHPLAELMPVQATEPASVPLEGLSPAHASEFKSESESDSSFNSESEPAPEALPPYLESTTEWYQGLTRRQQRQLRKQYILLCQNQHAIEALRVQNLFQEQSLRRLEQRRELFSSPDYLVIYDPWDYYNMFMMGYCASNLMAFNIQISQRIVISASQFGFDLRNDMIPALGNVANEAIGGIRSTFENLVREVEGSNRIDNDMKDAEGAIVVVAALVVAIGGGFYSCKKVFNSLKNILHGEKIAKSILRIFSIGGGAYVGVTQGMFIGALAGSAFPVIGTVAGAVIGAIAGCGIVAAAAGILSKYVCKAVNILASHWGFYGKEKIISPSNPEKYQLNKKEKANMLARGVINTNLINEMLESVKIQKKQLGYKASIPKTEQRALKNDLNELLKRGIKKNPSVVINGQYKTSSDHLLFWHTDSKQWLERRPAPQNGNNRRLAQ